MTPQPWNWGIPVNIPPPDVYGDQPIELASLRFSQIGLYDLRRRVGVLTNSPGSYNQHQQQFDNSDLAWFSSNLSSSQALLAPGAGPFAHQFHEQFRNLRQLTPSNAARLELRTRIRDSIFDEVRISQQNQTVN